MIYIVKCSGYRSSALGLGGPLVTKVVVVNVDGAEKLSDEYRVPRITSAAQHEAQRRDKMFQCGDFKIYSSRRDVIGEIVRLEKEAETLTNALRISQARRKVRRGR